MPRPFFYKLILSDIIQEEKLRIPDDFLTKTEDKLANVVKLSIPGEPERNIGLLSKEDKIWLHHGWKEFVEQYSIKVGFFLVFIYEGEALFTVHVFDLSNSELNYHSDNLTRHRSLLFEEMESEKSAENVGLFSPRPIHDSSNGEVFDGHMGHPSLVKCSKPLSLQNLFNESAFSNCVSWTSEDNLHVKSEDFTHGIDGPPHVLSAAFGTIDMKNSPGGGAIYTPLQQAKKPGRKRRKADSEGKQLGISGDDVVHMRIRFYESASARKRTVTMEERERALNAAKMFQSVNPFCRVVLRPSYLYKGCMVYLPACFAEKHLNGVSGFIKLEGTNGKQWPVRCLYRAGKAKLGQGWFEFSLENSLGEGDVCVFELQQLGDIVLKVTPFRVTENVGLPATHQDISA